MTRWDEFVSQYVTCVRACMHAGKVGGGVCGVGGMCVVGVVCVCLCGGVVCLYGGVVCVM